MPFDFNRMNSDDDEDPEESKWFFEGKKRTSRLGTVMLVTAIICALSNFGFVFLGHIARNFNKRQEVERKALQEEKEPEVGRGIGMVAKNGDKDQEPKKKLISDESKAAKAGEEAAPFLEFVCFSMLSLLYLPAFLGGLALQRGSDSLASTGAIMLMLPCSPGFLIGLGVGIWALTVLGNVDVKAYLDLQKHKAENHNRRRRRRRDD